MLQQAVDLRVTNSSGKTAIELALVSKDPGIIDAFKKYCSFNCISNVIKKNDVKALGQLIQIGVDVNAKDKDGKALLLMAVEKGNTATARELIKAGADVNAKDKDGKALLLMAVEKGNTATARELIKAGADVNAKDKDGKSLLIIAVKKGNVEVAEALIGSGIDVNEDMYQEAVSISKRMSKYRLVNHDSAVKVVKTIEIALNWPGADRPEKSASVTNDGTRREDGQEQTQPERANPSENKYLQRTRSPANPRMENKLTRLQYNLNRKVRQSSERLRKSNSRIPPSANPQDHP